MIWAYTTAVRSDGGYSELTLNIDRSASGISEVVSTTYSSGNPGSEWSNMSLCAVVNIESGDKIWTKLNSANQQANDRAGVVALKMSS